MRKGKRGVCVGGQRRLNNRQKAFADFYIECGNATRAAEKAGYSSRTAYSIGNENLKKPEIMEYIKERTTPTVQKRIASGDDVLRFFTRVMEGREKDVTVSDRITAGREILKRDIADKKLEIELLKLEDKLGKADDESDLDDALLDALNHAATDVWENSDNSGADSG